MGSTASSLRPTGLPSQASGPDKRGSDGGAETAGCGCPVPFGSISTTDKAAIAWRIELRRIRSSIKRELQSRTGTSASGLPCHYCSPTFQLTAEDCSLHWQLCFVPLELSVESVPLYLQVSDPNGIASGKIVKAHFSLAVSCQACTRSPPNAVASTEGCWWFNPCSARQSMQQTMCLTDMQRFDQAACAIVELRLHSVHLQSKLTVPGILISADPHISLISLQPRILLIENFLSATDCKGIIRLAEPDLHRSRVARGDMTASRTSSSTFLTCRKACHPDIQCFEERVSQLISMPAVMHGRAPLTKGEAVQVVRYQAGEFYAEHFDNKADDCSKRACTIMAYLSDVDAGGETFFRRSSGCPAQALQPGALPPKLQASSDSATRLQAPQTASSPMTGLRIPPKQGRAIMFWSRATSGEEDRASLHSGERVRQGEKWIASRWLQEEMKCLMPGRVSIEE